MPKRILQGVVQSVKNEKTVLVKVERIFRHPLYKKTVKKSSKYMAHCENYESYNIGDKIKIQEFRPISKNKSWIVVSK